MSSIREDVGLHFLIGLGAHPRLSERDRRLLSELRPAGVILFRGNFRHDLPYAGWLDELARLVEGIRAAIARPQILIAIDHEGGTVHRPPPPITRFAFARAWREQAAAVGDAMAVELASMGVNLSFAPVVDLDTNADNPVIGPRAFSSDARSVVDAASRFMTAMHKRGVWTCLKHFPGHGDTRVDSHEALPALDLDLPALRTRELAPFAALAHQAPMVMTAHILFPKIDAAEPATLSQALVDGVLRRELGFEGVVTTDDIGMKAMSARRTDPTFAHRVLQAGCDQIMVCDYWMQNEGARDLAIAITSGLDSGKLSETQVATSQARILKLLLNTPQHQVAEIAQDALAAHRLCAPLHHATAGVGRAGQSVSLSDEEWQHK